MVCLKWPLIAYSQTSLSDSRISSVLLRGGKMRRSLRRSAEPLVIVRAIPFRAIELCVFIAATDFC